MVDHNLSATINGLKVELEVRNQRLTQLQKEQSIIMEAIRCLEMEQAGIDPELEKLLDEELRIEANARLHRAVRTPHNIMCTEFCDGVNHAEEEA